MFNPESFKESPGNKNENIQEWERKTYYDRLGVSFFATADDIKNSFRELSLKYHPDNIQNKDYQFETYSQIQALITEAYNVLSKPEKRNKYDLSVQSDPTMKDVKTVRRKDLNEYEATKQFGKEADQLFLSDRWFEHQELFQKISDLLRDYSGTYGLSKENLLQILEPRIRQHLLASIKNREREIPRTLEMANDYIRLGLNKERMFALLEDILIEGYRRYISLEHYPSPSELQKMKHALDLCVAFGIKKERLVSKVERMMLETFSRLVRVIRFDGDYNRKRNREDPRIDSLVENYVDLGVDRDKLKSILKLKNSPS